jgi:hypothetical protein
MYLRNPSDFSSTSAFPITCAGLNTIVIDGNHPKHDHNQTWVSKTFSPPPTTFKNFSLQPLDPERLFNDNIRSIRGLESVIGIHIRKNDELGVRRPADERQKDKIRSVDSEHWRAHAVDETIRHVIECVPRVISPFRPEKKEFYRETLLQNFFWPQFAATWCEPTENYQVIGSPDRMIGGRYALPFLSTSPMNDPISKDDINDWILSRDKYFEWVQENEKKVRFTILKYRKDIFPEDVDRFIKAAKSRNDPENCLCNIVIETQNLDTGRVLETKKSQALWYLASAAISQAMINNDEKPILVFSLVTDAKKYILMGWQLNNLDFRSRELENAPRNLLYVWDLGDLFTSTPDYKNLKIEHDVYRKLLRFITQLYNISVFQDSIPRV